MSTPAKNSPAPTTTPDLCEAQRCSNRWASLVPDAKFKPSITAAIFGEDHDQEFYLVCGYHYRVLKNRDGVLIGYRMHNGKLVRYVREYLI